MGSRRDPKKIENQQKTLSGPQGVLLGVPREPQITQMAIQDAKMCLPKLTNTIRLWCQKGGKPESRRVKDWGPAAEGEALRMRRGSLLSDRFAFCGVLGRGAGRRLPAQCLANSTQN